jgi:hypothetical protein
MLIIIFDPQGVVHKEFAPEGKRVNAELYKGVLDRLLKRIQRVRPDAFCSRDCFLLHDNAPADQAAIIYQFLTLKYVTTLITSVFSMFISARLVSLPQVENEVKRNPLCGFAEIQESVTDDLKKVQKEEFSAAFQKLYDRAKACIYANGAYFE